MSHKISTLIIILGSGFITFIWLLSSLQIAQTAPSATTILYDGTLGSTPDTQSFEYEAAALPPPVLATQTYSYPLTILDTTPKMADYAGYAVTPTLAPTLERTTGFTLNFTIRIVSETHNSSDRAGFSVILLSEDLQGIELGFWANEIWAQEGGTTDLFTHAEGTTFNATTGLVNYQLEIISNTYQLSANGSSILSGPVRDYTAWEPPFLGLPDPYETPNFIFLGDNSSSAQAEGWLAAVSITLPDEPTPTPDFAIHLPLVVNE
jgi:hypothetical protein